MTEVMFLDFDKTLRGKNALFVNQKFKMAAN